MLNIPVMERRSPAWLTIRISISVNKSSSTTFLMNSCVKRSELAK